MPKKVMVLFAVAGLLAFAFAGQRAGSAVPARRHGGHYPDMDSLRVLRAKAKGAALPAGTEANKVIKPVRHDPKPGSLLGLNDNPYGGEIMPAPGIPEEFVNAQKYPAVAFDGTNYLVVWQDDRDGYQHIYGALVPASGTPPVVDGFPISPNTLEHADWSPSVAFDGTNFLVVWYEDLFDLEGCYNIRGARVNTSGTVLDPTGFQISPTSPTSYPWQPTVAFDGVNYLVVWTDDRGDGSDIYGARVIPSDHTVLDPDGLLISYTEEYSTNWFPSLAFDGTNYLVVWTDDRNGGDVYGARVNTRGNTVVILDPAGFQISTSSSKDSPWLPSVDFDGTDYLVVWEDDPVSSEDILGARVDPSGSVLDPDGIDICIEASDQQYPKVAFDGTDYLVAWQDDRNSHYYDIYGCQVSPTPEVGDPYQISSLTTNGLPALACGPVERTAMVAYPSITGMVDEVDYGSTYRIWARRATLVLNGTVDVGTVSIVRPVASFLWYDGENYSLPIPPVARLVNNGTEPCSFNAEFTMTSEDDDEVYASTKTVLGLRPSQTRSVEFDHDSFDLETEGPGLYTGTCATMLAGDGNSGNNTKDTIFQGCDFINFFDLGNGGLTATGAWTRDTAKRATWTWPPMDSIAWGDGIYGSYGNGENSTLTSPRYEAMDDAPAIAFQTNFIIEDPDDGGNFSYSTNGTNWTSLIPDAGPAYTVGNIPALGERGWTGSSDGWKQSVFVLDDVADGDPFWVRWRFASDVGGNDHGWLIDEVAGVDCDLYVGKMGAAGFIDTMKVWPNPARGRALVSYTLRRAGDVAIKLYDAGGRLARQVPAGGSKRGRNTATFDATRLARGVYFVKVEGASNYRTTKVIIE